MLLLQMFFSFPRSVIHFAVVAACASMGTAIAQSNSVAAPPPPDAPGFPAAPSSALPDVSRPGVGHGNHQRASGLNDDDSSHHAQHTSTDTPHFAWSQFLTDVSRTGMHFAVPRMQSGGMGGSDFMSGGPLGSGFGNGSNMGTGMNGAKGMNAVGMRGGGGGGTMDAGSALLKSLGDSTPGAMGTTFHTLSGLTDSRNGYAVPGTGSNLDFRLSGSLGNLMGMPTGGASMGSGSSMGAAGGNNGGLGTTNGIGGPASRGAGGRGPSVSLKLKF